MKSQTEPNGPTILSKTHHSPVLKTTLFFSKTTVQMDDEEINIPPLLSHSNPNSNDNNKSHGEKGMYMDWLGQRSTDDRDDLGGCNRAF